MNTAKIAAALHALADAFLEGADETAKPARGGKKTAAAVETATGTTVTTATPTVVTTPAPVVPSITLKEVNALVLKVAAKNRDGALAILGKFGLTNTVGLPAEKWQPLYDAFEEEIAKQDAAAVQVQQASLV